MTTSPLLDHDLFSGVPVQRTDLVAAVDAFVEAAMDGTGATAYRLVNSYSLALADQEPSYHSLLATQGVNLPDGKPLVVALNMLRGRTKRFGQVRGPSFFARCLDRGRTRGVRHFFVGGSPETLRELLNEVEHRYPGVKVAGAASPPFRPLTDIERQNQDETIRGSGADVVWVGLGTPKQDFEAQRISDDVGVVTAGVGAAFDFVAGTKREAHPLLSRFGLEWIFRLVTEPKRLWRRYLFGNMRFLRLALGEAIRRR